MTSSREKETKHWTQKAYETTDLINQASEGGNKFLKFVKELSSAPQKAVGAIVGSALCVVAWAFVSLPPEKWIPAAPFVAVGGAALGVLTIPDSIEDRRKRRLAEVQEAYKNCSDPELKQVYLKEIQVLTGSDTEAIMRLLYLDRYRVGIPPVFQPSSAVERERLADRLKYFKKTDRQLKKTDRQRSSGTLPPSHETRDELEKPED